ncbi:MAG: metal ABC transporter substrate-binding protein [Candidatus Acetothermia bacterium]|jgi:ABC-type Zn uptake system ZnuABC Zn-binding protein ZnuA|nr:metal ABC transporter substrate-binding protein [Candidatus Acetothermia bacterium]
MRLAILSVLALAVPLFGQPLAVVATSVVFGDLVQAVGGEEVTVTTLIPAGFCPAHYDLRPSDLLAVARAELVLYHGIEPWLERLLGNVNPGAKVLGLKGAWNTPELLAEKVRAVAQTLTELRPERAEYFAERLERFLSDLSAVAAAILGRAQELGLAEVPAIVMQWQADFAQWLGLTVVATYPPEERLTLRDLSELAAAGRKAGVLLVIDNLQSGTSFGARLAYVLGAVHVVLTNFPGAIPGAGDLVSMLEVNAQAVFAAVQTVRERP